MEPACEIPFLFATNTHAVSWNPAMFYYLKPIFKPTMKVRAIGYEL
jgi:hypothetical protein